MILIGQYDSPFVRRVAIALVLYNLPYEHRPWSTFGDTDKIAPYNPLRRVPTLALDNGEVLIESAAILDYVDELVGPKKALIARSGLLRRQELRICSLATGLCDMAVRLAYERFLHQEQSSELVRRCGAQIIATLDVLESDRHSRSHPYWFGSIIGHPDIAVACGIRFLREVHREIFDERRWPALVAHGALCEALPPFQAIMQPFKPPR